MNSICEGRHMRRIVIGLAIIGALVAGCSQTVSKQAAVQKEVESGEAPAASGFFGSDVSFLQPGQEGQAAMVYIAPNVNWKQYNKILLEPVEFWDSRK